MLEGGCPGGCAGDAIHHHRHCGDHLSVRSRFLVWFRASPCIAMRAISGARPRRPTRGGGRSVLAAWRSACWGPTTRRPARALAAACVRALLLPAQRQRGRGLRRQRRRPVRWLLVGERRRRGRGQRRHRRRRPARQPLPLQARRRGRGLRRRRTRPQRVRQPLLLLQGRRRGRRLRRQRHQRPVRQPLRLLLPGRRRRHGLR